MKNIHVHIWQLTWVCSYPQAGVAWRDQANIHFLSQLCYLLEEHEVAAAVSGPGAAGVKWTADECWLLIWHTCGQDLQKEKLVEGVRLGTDKTNLTECLAKNYALTPSLVAAAAPPKVRPRPYLPREFWPQPLGHVDASLLLKKLTFWPAVITTQLDTGGTDIYGLQQY